jgi:hypothetical protein
MKTHFPVMPVMDLLPCSPLASYGPAISGISKSSKMRDVKYSINCAVVKSIFPENRPGTCLLNPHPQSTSVYHRPLVFNLPKQHGVKKVCHRSQHGKHYSKLIAVKIPEIPSKATHSQSTSVSQAPCF